MKSSRTYLISFILIINLTAQSSGLGVGAVFLDSRINTDLGVNIKKWITDQEAINGSLILGKSALLITDYIWHQKKRFNDAPFYYGFGGIAGLGEYKGIGIHAIFGVDILVKKQKLDGFLEISPAYFLQGSKIDFFWNVGLRYFLHD